MGPQFGGIYGNVSDSDVFAELKGVGRAGFIGDAYREALLLGVSVPDKVGFKPFLWGQNPHDFPRNKTVPAYAPRPVPLVPGAVQIWQYNVTSDKTDVDLDLATQEAFDQMLVI